MLSGLFIYGLQKPKKISIRFMVRVLGWALDRILNGHNHVVFLLSRSIIFLHCTLRFTRHNTAYSFNTRNRIFQIGLQQTQHNIGKPNMTFPGVPLVIPPNNLEQIIRRQYT